MTTKEQAQNALTKYFSKFQDKQPVRAALTGDGSSSSTCDVDGSAGWIWVRFDANQNKATKVYGPAFRGYPQDIPVLIGHKHPQDEVEQVIGFNTALYWQGLTDWILENYQTPKHGQSHGETGGDRVPVGMRNIVPGQVHQSEPASTWVEAETFRYVNIGLLITYPGESLDLSSYDPGLGNHRYILVYVDSSANTIGASVSSVVTLPTPPDLPTVEADWIPLTVVDLVDGAIVEDRHIYDWRVLFTSLGDLPDHKHSGSGDGGASIIGLQELFFDAAAPLTLSGGSIYPYAAYSQLFVSGMYESGDANLSWIYPDPTYLDSAAQVIILRPSAFGLYDTYNITIQHAIGNIWLSGGQDIILTDTTDHIMLIWNGTYWCDIGGAAGGGGGCCIYSWTGRVYVPVDATIDTGLTFSFEGIDTTGLDHLEVMVYQEGLGGVTHLALNGTELGVFGTPDGNEQWKVFSADIADMQGDSNILQLWCSGPSGFSGYVLMISVIGSTAGGSSGVERSEWLQNGFVDETAVDLAWDDGTRTLTISPTGASYTYYHEGILYTKAGADTETIADTEGLWAFYFDAGSLESVHDPSHAQIDAVIENHAVVAYVYWDATNNDGRLMYELHGYRMSPVTHHWIHDHIGAAYYDGMTPADITIGDGSLNSHAQFSLGSGEFYDEDLEIELDAVVAATGLEVWYLDGADWRWTTNAGYSILTTGSGRMAWNDAGAQAEVDVNKYALCHIFATNIVDDAGANPKYIAIQGQNQYNTITTARTGADEEINTLVYGVLPLQEIVPVATFLFQTGNYANAVKSRIVQTDGGHDFVDWRGTQAKGSGAVVSEHGNLAGLADDDHVQYLLVDGTRAMTGGLDMGGSDITNLGVQSANEFWAGPTAGAAAPPIFRAIMDADIETISGLIWTQLHTFNAGLSVPTGQILNLADSVWRLGDVAYDLDFTGTDYDTKAECQAVGIRFSDSDTPYPAQHRYTVSGTWSHSAGNGWQPTSSTDEEGPAILIPLMRSGNWELEVLINKPTQNNQRAYTAIGVYQEGGHVGWFGEDLLARSVYYYRARLQTNDGDDTYTVRHLGTAVNTIGTFRTKIRQKNGVIGLYDEQDDTWHNYGTRFDAIGQAYPVTHLFIQSIRPTGFTYGTIYLTSLKLTYLV